MFEFLTYRETKRENYRIVPKRRMNRQRYYAVQYRRWLMGWFTFEEDHNTISMDKEFETKESAETFILEQIGETYDKLLK